MAKNNKIIKKNLKPELTYKVVPRKNNLKSVKKVSKSKSKYNLKTEKFLHRNKHTITLFVVCLICLILAFWYVRYTVRITNNSYKQSVESAKGLLTVSQNDIEKASVVGTNEQLANEVQNYQSAPDDLKEFILKDYRSFKTNCVVNGKLIGPIEYKIENVVYDQFARLKRTCVGDDSAIVAKIGGRWAVVTAGNALPECRVVNDLNLPQGVTFQCSDGLVIYTNPNP